MALLERTRLLEPPLSYAVRAKQNGAARDVLRAVGIQRIDGRLTGPADTDVELAQQRGAHIMEASVGHIVSLESEGIEFPGLEKPAPELTPLPVLALRRAGAMLSGTRGN